MHFTASRSFNPLCLSEGEQYVTDCAVAMNNQKGRIRVGTKSLVFEPQCDSGQDLVRFQYRYVTASEFSNDVDFNNNDSNTNASQISAQLQQAARQGKQMFIIAVSQYSRVKTRQIGETTRIVTPCNLMQEQVVFRIELLYAGPTGGNFGGGGQGGSNLISGGGDNKIQIILKRLINLENDNGGSGSNRFDTSTKLSQQQGLINELYRDVNFDLSRIEDHRERNNLLLPANGVWAYQVKPMLKHRGLIMITRKALYFQPVPNFLQVRFNGI